MCKMHISEKHLQEFDYIEGVSYLDWACLGLPPNRTKEFCRNFLDRYCDAYGRQAHGEYEKMRNQTRTELAKLLACDTEEIIFTKNTTEGNCMIANGMTFEEGDNVIIADPDYPGNAFCWIQKQEEGIELRIVKSVNGVVNEDEIISMMDPHTKVVSLSYVQYGSGYKADLKKIGEACRRRGILFSVDGIQGVGRQEINVRDFKIDLLSCAGFKGMMSVFGSAFTYCRKEVLAQLKPKEYGDNCAIPMMAYTDVIEDCQPMPLYEDYRRMEAGSLNTYGIGALGKSAELINEIGVAAIHTHIMELENEFRKQLAEKKLPLHILGSPLPKHWSGDIGICFEKSRTDELISAMRNKKIYATVENGYLRVALHYCNTQKDIDNMVSVLEAILQKGEKN